MCVGWVEPNCQCFIFIIGRNPEAVCSQSRSSTLSALLWMWICAWLTIYLFVYLFLSTWNILGSFTVNRTPKYNSSDIFEFRSLSPFKNINSRVRVCVCVHKYTCVHVCEQVHRCACVQVCILWEHSYTLDNLRKPAVLFWVGRVEAGFVYVALPLSLMCWDYRHT